MKKEILYYDGQCPLCSIEMSHLRERAGNTLELIDIHRSNDLPADKDACLKRLHLQTEKGLVVGIDANIAAWQHTSVGWLWRVLQLPLIKPAASKAYDIWAKRRFAKRYGQNNASV